MLSSGNTVIMVTVLLLVAFIGLFHLEKSRLDLNPSGKQEIYKTRLKEMGTEMCTRKNPFTFKKSIYPTCGLEPTTVKYEEISEHDMN